MKRLYSTVEFKRKHKRRLKYFEKKIVKDKKRPKPFLKLIRIPCESDLTQKQKKEGIKRIRSVIDAPSDFRLIENTDECLIFFKQIRSHKSCSIMKTDKFTRITLKRVKQIDYATINVLIAISRELKNRKVTLQGDFPENEACKEMMVGSGFLNYLYNDRNKPFPKVSNSETFFFKKGEGKLLQSDNILIRDTIRNAVKHLTGEEKSNKVIRSLLLEMFGNSIEHSGSLGTQWLLGVKYENNRVLFSVTDIGLGIIKTIHKEFRYKLADIFTSNNDLGILKGAFNKKYGSKTRDLNRNKGLPFIKLSSENKVLLNLIVLTNNVILHFDSDAKSKLITNNSCSFNGTMYQWELDKESLENSETLRYGNKY